MSIHTNGAVMKLWQQETKDKPFMATLTTAVDPSKLPNERYGYPFSAVFRKGERTYAFRTEAHRDRFIHDNAISGAKVLR